VSVEASSFFPAPAVTYGPGARKMLERAIAARTPLRGSIELTHRCNLACTHCYVRADFPDIYRYAHRKGFILTVYTNATLVTERIVALFRECPPATVDITQYGYTAETYDRVTDTGPGQHARYRRGLDRLLDAGLHVTLKAIAMRSNAREVPAMASFAAGLGLDFRLDAVISPRIDGGRKPLAERLTPAEVAAIETATNDSKLEWEEFCAVRNGIKPATDDLYQCGAGLANFVLDPYGRLHLCELSRTLGWDVLAHGFAKGWFEGIPERRAQKRQHNDGCGSCNAHGACSNCVGMAELERLAPEDGNPYFCHITDERGKLLFGDQRPEPNGLVRLRLSRQHVATP
jgi:radical SAM protein with 4Fe4S-binding SPASM domain